MKVLRQRWENVLFLHWPVALEAVQPLVPQSVEIDRFAGAAWLGIVAFEVTESQVLGFAGMGGLGRSPQVNLRTYVKRDGVAGVWFFSCDLDSAPLIWPARTLLRLPYRSSRMSLKKTGDTFELRAQRRRSHADFQAAWRPSSEPLPARAGTLDRFLTERYWAYFERGPVLLRQRIVHPSWSLERADLVDYRSSLSENVGLPHLGGAPLVHASPGLTADVLTPELVRSAPQPVAVPALGRS